MAKLTADGARLRNIIISTPFLVATSLLLYKRLVLGEEQRKIPPLPSARVDKDASWEREQLEDLRKRTTERR